jgi:hypothetical protein
MPRSTTVISSNSGRCPGLFPSGRRGHARDADLRVSGVHAAGEFFDPFGLVPAAAMTVGAAIRRGMGKSEVRSQKPEVRS